MVRVQLMGMTNFLRSMKSMETEILPAAKEVLYAEGQNILRESRKEVPFLRGVLSSSGRVHEPYVTKKKAVVEITYGGAAGGKFEGEGSVNYAIIQHENEKFRHAAGRKAFYLRDPVNRARSGFEQRLNERLGRVVAYRRRQAQIEGGEDADS